MGRREITPPLGQRWRSQADGHTVVTVGQDAAHVFVESDRDSATAAMIVADFLDDYAFVEVAARYGTT